MKSQTLLIILLLTIFQIGQSDFCHGQPGPIHNNTLPIWSDEPRLIKEVENGKLFEIGDPQYNNTMSVIHVYGSMYDMGWAQGQLLGQRLVDFLTEVWDYIDKDAADQLPKWIPESIKLDVIHVGLSAALDLTYLVTYKYTTKQYYTEMKALVESIGRPDLFSPLRRLHLIGELTKGACSMFGAWGNATKNGETLQLRALDWDFDGPFRKYPAIIVYHPINKEDGNTFANIGFTGWLGTLSGINEHQMAVSEIGVYFNDQTFGKESRTGNPFTFVLRDILQFDKNLLESVNRLQNEHRTCNLILGVGDGKPDVSSFRGFQYSYSVCNVISDTNLLPKNDTWHPQYQNVVYFGMDWNCPTYDLRFSNLLKQYHGQIDVETSIRQIIPGLTSGNLQVVLYDLTNMEIYVAYGYMTDDKKLSVEAFDKSFVKLNMRKLFAEPIPTSREKY